jgi:hypothetical protein
MDIKKIVLNAAKKEALKGVIGNVIPTDKKPGLTKTKMTLGALILAIAGLVFEYLT